MAADAPPPAKPKKPTKAEVTRVARSYFEAIGGGDVDAAVACWAPGGREHVHGQLDTVAPDGVRAFLEALTAAVPDRRMEVTALVCDAPRVAVQWRLTGTFAGAAYNGVAATGARLDLQGCDVLTIQDGLIVNNDAFTDGTTFARQIGMLPAQGSTAEARMTGAFNVAARVRRALAAGRPEEIADGVWVLRGGFPQRTMNVYLVRDGDGVLCFDAGIHTMTHAIAGAAAQLGGLTRVVLGHAHADHRGAAPGLGAPVLSHPAERRDAEGDGGAHYFRLDELDPWGRVLLGRLLPVWDGGPVTVSDTVREGDELAGFQVIDLPGHAPGLIGLWRESDRLALVSDCFYTLDPQTGRKGHARVPHRAFNHDSEQAVASIRKLAALEPATAWAGHADPLTGDVRGQLEHAAATT